MRYSLLTGPHFFFYKYAKYLICTDSLNTKLSILWFGFIKSSFSQLYPCAKSKFSLGFGWKSWLLRGWEGGLLPRPTHVAQISKVMFQIFTLPLSGPSTPTTELLVWDFHVGSSQMHSASFHIFWNTLDPLYFKISLRFNLTNSGLVELSFKNRLHFFRTVFDLQKNWKDSTERSCIPSTQLSLPTFHNHVALLLQLMNQYWCILIH